MPPERNAVMPGASEPRNAVLRAMTANLQRTTEPALRAKLIAAIEELKRTEELRCADARKN